MKKIIIIIFIILSLFILLFKIISDTEILLYINEGIYLPQAKNVKTIYQFDFRVGEDLLILTYNNKKFKKIISKKEFKLINQENLEIISEKVEEYYNRLDSSEKELFNKNVNIDKLLDINQNNMYLLKIDQKNEKTYVILLASIQERKIYYLNAVC